MALVKCSSVPLKATPVAGGMASDDERLYLATVNGVISAYESDGATVLWTSELGGEFASGVVVTEDGPAVITNPKGDDTVLDGEGSTVRLLGKEAGITTWSARIPYAPRYYLGRINGSLIALGSDGHIVMIDRANGRLVWQAGPFGRLSAKPFFSSTGIVFATADKSVVVISAKDGNLVSKLPTKFVPTSVAFTKNDGLVVGDERGNVSIFGQQNVRSVWRFKSGAGISFASETTAGILVTSLDNFVYLLSDYNGDVIWKKRLTGRVLEGGITINDNFIVLIYGENSGYVLDLRTGKITDSIAPFSVDLVNRVPVLVRNRTFAITTLFSLDIYSLGECPGK